jgi:hypothetical protein
MHLRIGLCRRSAARRIGIFRHIDRFAYPRVMILRLHQSHDLSRCATLDTVFPAQYRSGKPR